MRSRVPGLVDPDAKRSALQVSRQTYADVTSGAVLTVDNVLRAIPGFSKTLLLPCECHVAVHYGILAAFSSSANGCSSELRVDGVSQSALGGDHPMGTSAYMPLNGTWYGALASGSHTFEVWFRTFSGTPTSLLWLSFQVDVRPT